jgi:DNA-binding IclR family transcriptional regulator
MVATMVVETAQVALAPGAVGSIPDTSSPTPEVMPEGRLVRDLALLDRLADAEAAGEPGLGVSALAELTGRDKSQVSRALGRLADAGFVERDSASLRYSIGWTVFSLAMRASSGRLIAAATGPMRALSTELGETVHLCVLDGSELVTLRTEAPGHRYRATGWVGTRVPAYATSAGRALLFDATEAEIERRFGQVDFSPSGPRARVRDIASLVTAVAEARDARYAVVDEEFEAGVAGVSAPIRDFRGAVVAALNVSAPADRLRPHLASAGERTRATADMIGGQLGWMGAIAFRPAIAGPS